MKRILIIEDESAIADTIHYALSTDGFDVEIAGTGQAGKAKLAAGGIDLVILDIGLPDQSGLDLCREIKRTTDVPLIFLTARGSEVDRVVGLEIGADDYVVKPFSPRELSARVRAVLRRTERPADAAVPAQPEAPQPFEVDSERREIRYFGVPLKLTRYEYQLLELLISRPGWVFTRDKLMEMIWDDPAAAMDRTVDSHIKSLRSRLREVRDDIDAIVTHRGVGYALKEDW